MVNVPNTAITIPISGFNGKKLTKNLSNMYIGSLIIIPLSRAETLLGASGWASGSHEWNGTMAALTPNPTSNANVNA